MGVAAFDRQAGGEMLAGKTMDDPLRHADRVDRVRLLVVDDDDDETIRSLYVAREAERARLGQLPTHARRVVRRDLCCTRCSYGIVSHAPPERCPMCGNAAVWAPVGRARFQASA